MENSLIGLRYNSMYRATVLQTAAEDGRIKLYVYGVTPQTIDDYRNDPNLINDLPFAEPALSLFGGVGDGNGLITYPHINATLWCFFENGDYMKPVYFACCPAGPSYLNEWTTVHNDYENLKNDSKSWNDNREEFANTITGKKPEQYLSDNIIQHRLKIQQNTIDFFENGLISLYVENPFNPDATSKIDIYPNLLDITIKNSGANSNIKIVPGEETITIPEVIINGNVTINGELHVSNNITANQNIIGSFGNTNINLVTHTHTGNLGSPTSPPIPNT